MAEGGDTEPGLWGYKGQPEWWDKKGGSGFFVFLRREAGNRVKRLEVSQGEESPSRKEYRGLPQLPGGGPGEWNQQGLDQLLQKTCS